MIIYRHLAYYHSGGFSYRRGGGGTAPTPPAEIVGPLDENVKLHSHESLPSGFCKQIVYKHV